MIGQIKKQKKKNQSKIPKIHVHTETYMFVHTEIPQKHKIAKYTIHAMTCKL